MMSVVFHGDQEAVVRATGLANGILSNPQFYTRIRERARFDLTEVTPQRIATLMEQCAVQLRVELYRHLLPSRALGYEDPAHPDRVFLNARKLDRSDASIVGTIIHEAVHAVDAVSPERFGHGDNSPVGKDNTAPYWIGNLAISLVSGAAFAEVDHAPHDVEQGAAA